MECRSVVMLAVVVAFVTGQRVVADEAEDRAIAYIEKIGGEVMRSPTKPGKPAYRVVLSYTKVTDGGLKHLAAFPQLREIYLTRTRVTGAGLKHLASLPQLIRLSLDESSVTDTDLKDLAPLQQLSRLSLISTQVTDAGLKELARLKGLTSLKLNHTKVTDAGLKALTPLQGLTSLELADTKVTDAGLKDLTPLQGLTYLDLADTQVTGAGVKQLAPLRNLYSIRLNGTKVTDADIKDVASLPGLIQIGLYGTNVTDAGIKELVAIKRLDELQLSGSGVTDAGIRELAHAKHLRELILINTKVTNDGAAFLKKSLPACSIVRTCGTSSPKPTAALVYRSVENNSPVAAGSSSREIAPFPRRTPPLPADQLILGTWKQDNETSRPLSRPELEFIAKFSENETIDMTHSDWMPQQRSGTYRIRDNILQIDFTGQSEETSKIIYIIELITDNRLILTDNDKSYRCIFLKIKQ